MRSTRVILGAYVACLLLSCNAVNKSQTMTYSYCTASCVKVPVLTCGSLAVAICLLSCMSTFGRLNGHNDTPTNSPLCSCLYPVCDSFRLYSIRPRMHTPSLLRLLEVYHAVHDGHSHVLSVLQRSHQSYSACGLEGSLAAGQSNPNLGAQVARKRSANVMP